MKWKTFTEEELKSIRANPYVKSATSKMVRFTVEFKEEFWRQYNEECKSPRRIIESMGLDAEVLGEKRISGILMHIRQRIESGENLRDYRKTPESELTDIRKLPPSKAMQRMQHKILYMEQELEFIKKTILADREVRQK